MKNWWKSLSIATRLNIPIQVILVVVLSFAHVWEDKQIKSSILDGAEMRASASADGVINGMNMLMVTGMISSPENRRLFIKKMGASENVKELRIFRTKQVQDQFGIGLPEEQIKDNMDRRAIQLKHAQFLLTEGQNITTLRAVVPFIVGTNFRGTNCLMCHHVEVGSVNGAASIVFDMTREFSDFKHKKFLLWLGQVLLQILLYFFIKWIIRRFLNPITKLQSAMVSMQAMGSMEKFVPIEMEKDSLDEISKLTSAFNQMSEALCNSEKSTKLAAAVYQSNADAIVVTDENNFIVDVNPAFQRISGYTPDEVIGKNPKLMQSGRHDKEFYRQMWHEILAQGHWQGEMWDKHKNGGDYLKMINIVVLRHADGSVYRYVAQFSDITEKKEKEELIQWQANYDPLTNLPNRRLFHDRLSQTIKMAYRTKCAAALLFIDLDHFKEINDNLGHANGDALLMDAARRISRCVREADTVSRLGGDEFTVILPEIGDKFQAERIAGNIVQEMARPFFFLNDETAYYISASIGVAIYPDNASTLEGLLKCADNAMYAAKSEGRNRAKCSASGK